MIRCSICGDEGFMPELDVADEGFVCNSAGCDLSFGSDEFNEGDLSYGFHIVDTDEDAEAVL